MPDDNSLTATQQIERLKNALRDEKLRAQKLEEELKNSQQGWSGQWEFDLVTKQVSWSPEMYQLLQVDDSTKPDMRIFNDHLPPACKDKLNGALSKIFVEGRDYSFEHTIQSGDNYLMVRTDLKPVFNQEKRPIKVSGKLTDITANKSAQKELEKLSKIAGQTSNAVVTLDVEARVEWVNSAFTITTGYRPDEVQGMLFDDLIGHHGEKCCKELFEEAFQTSSSVIQELQIENKQGKPLWVVLNASAILDYELNPESYIVIITDITERKQAEQLLAKKNQEITDSIRYARRLQYAMLPTHDEFSSNFNDHFVLFRPKDIVSGDFYWLRERNGKTFLAVADCTGHGVPGAFVSLLCFRALNRAIIEFDLCEPGKILDKVTELVESNFMHGSTAEMRDGMDICLLAFDHEDQIVEYAGANNALYYFDSGELVELKANKQPIGFYENRSPFDTHAFELKKGDRFYLFSDGYPDQFGGDRGKKLKSGKFKSILTSIQKSSMSDQNEILDREFENWKGDHEQIDDVCVLGVEV